jgi:phage terminase large subunit-like protein
VVTTATVLSYDLHKTLRLIPGYDPFATAGPCWFDEEAAQLRIDFIQECCTFSQGEKAGRPFVLEPWEQAIVANLFGWKRPDGTRRYREGLLFIPRKNGKSELAAVIIVCVLYLDDEPGAQLYSAAGKRDQTKYVFDPVRKMIAAEPELLSRAEVYRASIVVGDKSYRTIAAEAVTEHGGNTHLAVVDELHAQPNRDLVDVLKTSMIGRRQPLLFHITTSDFERVSICNEKHRYACQVRDGIIDDSAFLPVIYEAQRDEDYTDRRVWYRVNPNLGVSIREDDFAAQCKLAQDVPSFLNTFLRLHLNVRTEQQERWLLMDKWDACPSVPLSADALCGRPCWCGLDLSTTTDLSCFAQVFRDEDIYHVLLTAWMPKENAERRQRRDRVPYLQWIREGWLRATEGEVIDYHAIRRDITELAKLYDVREIATDPWNATGLICELREEDGLNIFEHRQGFASMSGPSKETEALVVSGRLNHGGNPVLRWAASNVSKEEDAAGNIKPSKRKSTERIDPVVALIMAVGRAVMNHKGRRSVYATRGLRFV